MLFGIKDSDADGLHSPSGLRQPFSGPPCPETAGIEQDNGKYQYPPQVANPKTFQLSALPYQKRDFCSRSVLSRLPCSGAPIRL